MSFHKEQIMHRHRFVAALALGLFAFVQPASVGAQEKAIELSGELKIGLHKLNLEEGMAYEIEVKGKNFTPQVNLVGIPFLVNNVPFGKEQNTFRTLFFPTKTNEYVLTVLPGFSFNPPQGALEYKATVKGMKLVEVLKKQDKLSVNDPQYKNPMVIRKSPHKMYVLKMKAGQTYIIDMVRQGNSNLDPYLYIENAKLNVLASDDDGGGFPNARITFRAPEDGTYRIIASALSDASATGEFVLTVRSTKEQ
ncbi:MAG TPA: PPC domain-containing protein [Gemmataceae bacterium]|nr:PPC domain-containing protein [Gemmataceae bacterium]